MSENKYCYKYPHPSVTTDCVIFGFDGEKLNVLLIKRGGEPFKSVIDVTVAVAFGIEYDVLNRYQQIDARQMDA